MSMVSSASPTRAFNSPTKSRLTNNAAKTTFSFPFITGATQVADAVAIDYLLERVLELRFKYFSSKEENDKDDDYEENLDPETVLALEMADAYSLEANNLIKMMERVLEIQGQDPKAWISFDPSLRKREQTNKVLGLACFHADRQCPRFDPISSSRGSCCLKHKMQGWAELAFELEEVDIPSEQTAEMLMLCVDVRSCVVVYGTKSHSEYCKILDKMFPPEICYQTNEEDDDHKMPLTQLHSPTHEEPKELNVQQVYKRTFAQRREMLHLTMEEYKMCEGEALDGLDRVQVERNLFNWLKAHYQAISFPKSKLLTTSERAVLSLESDLFNVGNRISIGRNSSNAFNAHLNSDSKKHLTSPAHATSTKRVKINNTQSGGDRILWSEEDINTAINLPPVSQAADLTSTFIKLEKDSVQAIMNRDSRKLPPIDRRGKSIVSKGTITPIALSSTANSAIKQRRPFSDSEIANLIAGCKKYGRNWSMILERYKFDGRTNVDLKDKARNLEKKGLLQFVKGDDAVMDD